MRWHIQRVTGGVKVCKKLKEAKAVQAEDFLVHGKAFGIKRKAT